MRLATGLLLLAALALGGDKSEDANAVVFLGPLKGRDEGAPSQAGLAQRVIVTNVANDPAWKGVFDVLRERGYAAPRSRRSRNASG